VRLPTGNPGQVVRPCDDVPARAVVLHVRSGGAVLGAEQVVIELSRQSPRYGYTPVVAALRDARDGHPPLCQAAEEYGIEVLAFPCSAGIDLSLVARLRHFVRQRGVSIVHSHGYKEDVHVALARLPVATLATNHLWKRTNWRLRAYARADALALRSFDHIVAVSSPIKDEMVSLGIDPGRVSVIANGIDVARYAHVPSPSEREACRAELGVERSDFVAIAVGSLTPEKGHRELVRAIASIAARFPSLRCVIVGDGPLRESLSRSREDLGIASRVILTGARTDVPRLLRSADVFVLPSLREGLPMALLEAMAASLPCVASAVGDVPSVIRRWASGILCRPGNVHDLAEALSAYLADPTRRQEHGRVAREVVAMGFSSAVMGGRYAALYDGLIDSMTR
jgi:glycosyltransferase involved in cell wall biosynthesis